LDVTDGSGSKDLKFRITDPDPGDQLFTDPPDPDPEHCENISKKEYDREYLGIAWKT
jgi:hypothetical protein